MSRSIRSFAGLAIAFTFFGQSVLPPVGVHAQSAPTIQTPDQVRARFIEAGYSVGEATTWWTNSSTTFTVFDPARASYPDGRMVMVLVYPDMQTAQAERDHAIATGGAEGLADPDLGPRLVPGYGPSTWQANVALVESNLAALNRFYQSQIEQDLGTAIAIGPSTNEVVAPPSPITTAVDVEFVVALQQGGQAGDL
jgi:hypothetical protein